MARSGGAEQAKSTAKADVSQTRFFCPESGHWAGASAARMVLYEYSDRTDDPHGA